MNMDLKELLGDELYAQVDAKIAEVNGADDRKENPVKFVDLSEGAYVSKEKYTGLKTEADGYKKQLTEANTTIESYKEMDIEGIKKSADEWKQKYETDTAALNQQIETQKRTFAAEKYLDGQKIKSPLARKSILSDFMAQNLEFKDGTFVGADDYMKKMREQYPNDFENKQKVEPPQKKTWVRGTSGTYKPGVVDSEESYLKQKYGAGVSVQNVGKDQSSIDRIGAGTAGTGNVVIASNILEQMANDPEKAAYYEKKIQEHFDSLPQTEAFMAAVGHKITSCGVVVHEDGTVTYYLSGEESPEKKAKVEAEQKEKQEKKAARHQENLKRSQEAAEKRRQEMKIAYRKQTMEEMLANRTMDAGRVTYTSTSAVMGSAIEAYEKNIMDVAGILK